ncbi:HAD family hydrolase [Microcoleus sp. FACHB-1515]|uniref:D-glycero-alpha-D-manno-heptose-1,7-bisphosphate 7-phosphatase n=1 Tax=Cyanophyceae TaxID=3028117 RepID=UPI00168591E3|nr:HAD family hydrolase [Microcoleus sp. FACHB-1515]MBD2091732.1 HAD family hydrolase [Microcoleus sp. FACHB-1515]
MNRAIFLDKDGTLIEDVPYNVDPDRIRLCQGAIEGLRSLHAVGYKLIVISNQSGIARGYFPARALMNVEQRLQKLLDVSLSGFYYCPHHPGGTVDEFAIECDCRKPKPGMLLQAAKDHDIDLARSWFIGDILNDVEAGRTAGCRTILIDNGNETEWILKRSRLPNHIVANLTEAARIVTAIDQPTQAQMA